MTDTPLMISTLAGLEMNVSGIGPSATERQKLTDALRVHARAFPGLGAYDLGERLLDFVTDSLRKPVGDVLATAWKQRKEMRDIAAKGEGGRDVQAEVELVTHYVSWALHPAVEIALNGASVGRLTFDVDLSLKLEGVQLVIRNARITSVKTGTLTAMLELKCGGLPLLATQKRTVDLPGTLTLPGDGLDLGSPIPPEQRHLRVEAAHQ